MIVALALKVLPALKHLLKMNRDHKSPNSFNKVDFMHTEETSNLTFEIVLKNKHSSFYAPVKAKIRDKRQTRQELNKEAHTKTIRQQS